MFGFDRKKKEDNLYKRVFNQMRKIVNIVIFFLGLLTINSQIIKNTIGLETPILDETSGLIYYNNTLITHNDSGNEASLYEIDTVTGAVLRTVIVSGATNVDWEDITQDESYLYIGDIGNNFGNRTDLKIYKIAKEDYNDTDDMVTPEVITYSYANQSDFTSNLNANNWDAEGLVSYDNNLLVFTKNWENKKVNVYSVSKNSGNHVATLESNYDVSGLITGVDVSVDEKTIYLIGYNDIETPFMYTIHAIPNNSLDIFSGTVSAKISGITPIGNQVEAVSFIETISDKHFLYISNEKFITPSGSIGIDFPAKLRMIEIDVTTTTLATEDIPLNNLITIFPNPFDSDLQFNRMVDEILVFDSFGRIVRQANYVNKVSLEKLNRGVYIASIKVDASQIVKKIIKK